MNSEGRNVVILGRPNVGKSTLFNRIIKRRIAITLKEPGTTRDRIKAETEWEGVKFSLTDTGGFISEKPSISSEITKKVNYQINQAIKSADTIIFLVDGSASPTSQDFAIAELLRKEQKSFLLAVNKIDRNDAKDNLSEFYQLGAKELIQISAEHGTGVDVLLDAVVEELKHKPPSSSVNYEEPYLRFLIIGRPNVGKSMFLNSLLNEERVIVSEKPGTTRDAIEDEFIFDNKRLRIIDTAGLRKKPRVSESVEYFSIQRVIKHIPLSDIIFLLLDASTQNYPPMPLTKQDKNIIDLVLARGKGMVIAINKIDLIPVQQRKNMINNTRVELKNFDFIPMVLTSALKNKGIIETVKKAIDVFEQGRKRVSDELVKETVLPRLLKNMPSHRARFLTLRQTSVLPPKFELATNAPKDVKDSYQRFVINEIRNYFGFLGNQIHLKITRK